MYIYYVNATIHRFKFTISNLFHAKRNVSLCMQFEYIMLCMETQ